MDHIFIKKKEKRKDFFSFYNFFYYMFYDSCLNLIFLFVRGKLNLVAMS